jgi:hypothetical protein
MNPKYNFDLTALSRDKNNFLFITHSNDIDYYLDTRWYDAVNTVRMLLVISKWGNYSFKLIRKDEIEIYKKALKLFDLSSVLK